MPSDTVSSVRETPPEVLALLALPPLDTLSADRARGAVCLWCPVRLTVETAVDLGEQSTDGCRWWPRACGPCVGRRAHRALYDHVALCEPCVDDVGQCATGLTLSRLVRKHRR
ncbi:hypothetical protein TU94_15950 [Streptomyces cyaneogriseus subsp. noncyanogenus]|uniref:Uncharacterized protein n=1 Tax=Streptomyces cyaneogriseus subsp. noncyanogenus TaxID=477245 RepID=A0A0C5G3E6_9ACTN|nr:hypothetical protein TU94_15950 [Streptomyces cyaneogriseus subsp. noncyanogenus]